MKLHVLIDNLPNPANPALQHEHGLCLLLQTPEGKNYLIDTGASGAFVGNMEHMGLCGMEEVDAVFISHGHNDHTGGLRSFLELNTSAPVYLHNTIRGNYFYSCRPKNGVREARNIGMEQALFAEYGSRLQEIDTPARICEKITLIPVSSSAGYSTPMGNGFLYCNDFPDKFTHEVAILVEHTPGKFAVISPCSHNGILNILECCMQFLSIMTTSKMPIITHFIGGLHYVDYLLMGEGKKEAAQIIQAAGYIKEKYPNLKIVSGHCTCSKAGDILKSVLDDRYATFCSGYSILL